jgi:guanosine-3',5'-bis(diphosphate) 3'-pyrophosphohydrolase
VVAGARTHQGLHCDAAAQRLSIAAHLGDQRSRLAEEGIAAHWKYKEGRVGAQRDEQYFQWLRQLLEWQQDTRDPQEFLSNLKIDLYPEEVYTFTPRGTVKVLPKGSTAIDFAYAIHTDVGHQCVGARVNGRMVPLRTRLKNGDIVEIVRNAAHKPSRDWLNFAVTSRARNKIKHLIQVEEKERAIELGKRVFEKEARRFGLNGVKLLEGDVTKVLAEFALAKPEDLLAQIGYGKVSPRLLLDKIVPHDQLKEQAPEHPVVSAVKRVLRQGSEPDRIKVRGADDVMVFRAKCCNPIRGEKIVGYITRGKGVSVHSAKCTNVINLMYDPERRIDVEWDKGSDIAPYTVRLAIEVEDRKGMLAELSQRISDINTNITNVEARTGDQRGRIDVTVEIKDVKHLEQVIKSVRGVEGVLNVERTAPIPERR